MRNPELGPLVDLVSFCHELCVLTSVSVGSSEGSGFFVSWDSKNYSTHLVTLMKKQQFAFSSIIHLFSGL
jgi:hypothetical protein